MYKTTSRYYWHSQPIKTILENRPFGRRIHWCSLQWALRADFSDKLNLFAFGDIILTERSAPKFYVFFYFSFFHFFIQQIIRCNQLLWRQFLFICFWILLDVLSEQNCAELFTLAIRGYINNIYFHKTWWLFWIKAEFDYNPLTTPEVIPLH